MKEHRSYQTGWSEITRNTCPEGWSVIDPKGHSKPHHQLFAPCKPGVFLRFIFPLFLLCSLWNTHTHSHLHTQCQDLHRYVPLMENKWQYRSPRDPSTILFLFKGMLLNWQTLASGIYDTYVAQRCMHYTVKHVFPQVVSAQLIQHNDSGL